MKGRRVRAEEAIVLSTTTAPIAENGSVIKMFRSLFFCAILLQVVGPAFAQTIDVDRLTDAIRKQENSYNHPYGILRDYCKPGDPDGQCRKGCVQTINKRLKMWKADGEPGDFISYLGKSYCPPSAHPLNKHWVKGVTYFYGKGGLDGRKN